MGHIVSKKSKKSKKKIYPSNPNSQCSVDHMITAMETGQPPIHLFNQFSDNNKNKNFDINHPTSKNNQTLLHLACIEGNTDVAELLIKAGASPNSRGPHGFTPLDLAIQNENLPCAKLIFKHGGIAVHSVKLYLEDFNFGNIDASYDDIAKKKTIEMKKFLLEHSIQDLRNRHDSLETFVGACMADDIVTMRVLLSANKFHPSQVYNIDDGGSITRWAAVRGKFPTVKLLVEYGGLIIEDNLPGEIGVTTAIAANRLGYTDIAEFLEKKQKERVNCLDYIGKCALMMFGLFKDKKSILHTELGKQRDISEHFMREIFEFGLR